MKQIIFNNWNFMRFLRLGLGIAIIVQAAMAGNWIMGIAGLLFTALPVFNIGCCSTTGCDTPAGKATGTTKKDIQYEEVV